MNARRMIEVRETIKVNGKLEELVYHVQVIEPSPAPSDLNPYGDEGRCFARPIEAARPVVAPVVAKRVPSKAEYVRSFGLAGALPACVVARCEETAARIGTIADYFRIYQRRMNVRLAKALARFDAADLASVYDAGALGRIAWLAAGRVFRDAVLALAAERRPAFALSL